MLMRLQLEATYISTFPHRVSLPCPALKRGGPKKERFLRSPLPIRDTTPWNRDRDKKRRGGMGARATARLSTEISKEMKFKLLGFQTPLRFCTEILKSRQF